MNDKRIIPGWRTDLKEKRDRYLALASYISSLEEANEKMNRQIAHYDDELSVAKQCIDDIFRANGARRNNHINDEEFKDRVDSIIREYYNKRNRMIGYSDENVICITEYCKCKDNDLEFNQEAYSLEIRDIGEYI